MTKCAEIIPAVEIPICDLLAQHQISLKVTSIRDPDKGEWKWMSYTSPELINTSMGSPSNRYYHRGVGGTVEEAIGALCDQMSGRIVQIPAKSWWRKDTELDFRLYKVTP